MPENGPKTVEVNVNGGDVTMEVFFGFNQYGEYVARIYDKKGRNPVAAGIGNNIDAEPDKFPITGSKAKSGIKKAADLKGRVVTWRLIIATTDEPKSSPYFAQVKFTQDGRLLTESPFEYAGDLDRSQPIVEGAKFVA